MARALDKADAMQTLSSAL